MTKTEAVRCPDCFGTGVLGGVKQTKRERKCPLCKGKGKIKAGVAPGS